MEASRGFHLNSNELMTGTIVMVPSTPAVTIRRLARLRQRFRRLLDAVLMPSDIAGRRMLAHKRNRIAIESGWFERARWLVIRSHGGAGSRRVEQRLLIRGGLLSTDGAAGQRARSRHPGPHRCNRAGAAADAAER